MLRRNTILESRVSDATRGQDPPGTVVALYASIRCLELLGHLVVPFSVFNFLIAEVTPIAFIDLSWKYFKY